MHPTWLWKCAEGISSLWSSHSKCLLQQKCQVWWAWVRAFSCWGGGAFTASTDVWACGGVATQVCLLLMLHSHPEGLAENEKQWATMAFHELTSWFTMSPPHSKKQLTALKKLNGKKAMANKMKWLKDNNVWKLASLPPGKKAWVYKRWKQMQVANVTRLDLWQEVLTRSLAPTKWDLLSCWTFGVAEDPIALGIPEQHLTGRSPHETTHWLWDRRWQAPHVQVEEEYLYMYKSSHPGARTQHSTLTSRRWGSPRWSPTPVSEGEDTFYIGVYVNDMILAGKDKAKMKRAKEELSSRFDIKDSAISWEFPSFRTRR